jgi:hypothetical protein
MPDTEWIGGWVGPRADLEAVAERNISFTHLTMVVEPVV